MTKEGKIKEAYGEHWDLVKDYVERNGWITVSDLLHLKLPIAKIIDCDIEDVRAYRPKSLRGIENNNGWTKIETKEDLPEFGYYEVVVRSNGILTRATLDEKTPLVYYSHYQTISELKPPLH
jgi:hypothetical protein